MKGLAYALLLALLLVLPGCTIRREYVGGQLSQTQLQALEEAQTKAEVLSEVGPPEDVGIQLNESLFIYRVRREDFENLNLSFFRVSFDYTTTDRRVPRLVVFFDKQGQKTGYGIDDGFRQE